jgi:hypothetical protein
MDKDVEKLGRRSKEMESMKAIERRRLRSNAPVSCAKEGNLSLCDRSQPDGDRSHLCVTPKSVAALFWKFLILGFCNSLLHKDSNPTIFRVSRILLESINRLVNTKERHTIFGEELTTFKEQFFGFILFLYLFYEDD